MSGFKEFAKALGNMMRNQVGVKIAKLEAKADAEYPHTEDECYVAEHMGQLDFEMLNDNGDVYACTLGQVLSLLRARGGGIERLSTDRRNIKMSSQGVAVDQDYYWNDDMATCPDGKVQLLTKSGLPHYGRQVEAPGFFVAWAPLPKKRDKR